MKNITTITIILLLCIAMGCYLFLGGSREENSQISDIDTEYSFLKYVAGEKYGAVDFYGLFQDKIEYSYQVDDWVEVNKDKYIYLGPQWSIVDINNLNNEKKKNVNKPLDPEMRTSGVSLLVAMDVTIPLCPFNVPLRTRCAIWLREKKEKIFQ